MGTETPITPTEQEIREVIALKWASGGLAEPGDWVRKATEGDQETLAQVRRWRGLITRYRRREGEEEAREHIARVVSEMDAWIAREPERRAEQEERAREDEWRRTLDALGALDLSCLRSDELLDLRARVEEECSLRLLIPLPRP